MTGLEDLHLPPLTELILPSVAVTARPLNTLVPGMSTRGVMSSTRQSPATTGENWDGVAMEGRVSSPMAPRSSVSSNDMDNGRPRPVWPGSMAAVPTDPGAAMLVRPQIISCFNSNTDPRPHRRTHPIEPRSGVHCASAGCFQQCPGATESDCSPASQRAQAIRGRKVRDPSVRGHPPSGHLR